MGSGACHNISSSVVVFSVANVIPNARIDVKFVKSLFDKDVRLHRVNIKLRYMCVCGKLIYVIFQRACYDLLRPKIVSLIPHSSLICALFNMIQDSLWKMCRQRKIT